MEAVRKGPVAGCCRRDPKGGLEPADVLTGKLARFPSPGMTFFMMSRASV